MKQVYTLAASLFFFSICNAQNVGIGTTNPLARLHVADSNVIFTAPSVIARPAAVNVPVSGSGTRCMWLPGLSAFRAGTVYGPDWNSDSIGLFSFAAGFDTRATGSYSSAMGARSQASGDLSLATGFSSVASGNTSTATGNVTVASGNFSFAAGDSALASGYSAISLGNKTQATGDYSFAAGRATRATGVLSTAIGYGTRATGAASTAMGSGAYATGVGSVATGGNTQAASLASVAMGQFNDTIAGCSATAWVNTDPILYVGNGENPDFTHNAAVIYKNGNADLNGYVRLGDVSDSAPRIKVKKLTAVMPASQGGITFVAHHIIPSKILSVSALATVAQYQIIPNHMQSGFQYTLNIDGGNIALGAVSGNSTSVLNAPVKILITYEE